MKFLKHAEGLFDKSHEMTMSLISSIYCIGRVNVIFMFSVYGVELVSSQ